jgi:hypothetical protein
VGSRDGLWGFERRGYGVCEVARRAGARFGVVALDRRLGAVEPIDFERCRLIALGFLVAYLGERRRGQSRIGESDEHSGMVTRR